MLAKVSASISCSVVKLSVTPLEDLSIKKKPAIFFSFRFFAEIFMLLEEVTEATDGDLGIFKTLPVGKEGFLGFMKDTSLALNEPGADKEAEYCRLNPLLHKRLNTESFPVSSAVSLKSLVPQVITIAAITIVKPITSTVAIRGEIPFLLDIIHLLYF